MNSIEALRKDFSDKDAVVICILSNEGELCDSNCTLFEKCWGKESA